MIFRARHRKKKFSREPLAVIDARALDEFVTKDRQTRREADGSQQQRRPPKQRTVWPRGHRREVEPRPRGHDEYEVMPEIEAKRDASVKSRERAIEHPPGTLLSAVEQVADEHRRRGPLQQAKLVTPRIRPQPDHGRRPWKQAAGASARLQLFKNHRTRPRQQISHIEQK